MNEGKYMCRGKGNTHTQDMMMTKKRARGGLEEGDEEKFNLRQND